MHADGWKDGGMDEGCTDEQTDGCSMLQLAPGNAHTFLTASEYSSLPLAVKRSCMSTTSTRPNFVCISYGVTK
eukprot:352861-Chlamydomonas_euryale.AAC.10